MRGGSHRRTGRDHGGARRSPRSISPEVLGRAAGRTSSHPPRRHSAHASEHMRTPGSASCGTIISTTAVTLVVWRGPMRHRQRHRGRASRGRRPRTRGWSRASARRPAPSSDGRAAGTRRSARITRAVALARKHGVAELRVSPPHRRGTRSAPQPRRPRRASGWPRASAGHRPGVRAATDDRPRSAHQYQASISASSASCSGEPSGQHSTDRCSVTRSISETKRGRSVGGTCSSTSRLVAR